MHDVRSSPLHRIVNPRSVAFWGASSDPMSMGSVQLSSLLAFGYQGKVYPVHPRERTVMGLTAYPSAADLPEPVDLAVFVLPTRVVPEILEDCGKAGIKRAIIVSAGFGEMGRDGQALQNRIVEIADRYEMCVIGPNCIGVVNPSINFNTTFFPYFAKPGFIGMASQSGSFVTQMFDHLGRHGLGFSQAFSVGNEAVTDIVDCMEYLAESPETKVIALYIEAIRRGREFARVARKISQKKPIVAHYVGGSSAGKQAALSHTGALAGPELLYDGIFAQSGVIRAATIEQLFDFCAVLGSQPLPNGNRVALLTHSGGPGAAAADAAEREGLVAAKFSEQTIERLREIVPHTASIANPVDITFSRNPSDYTKTLPSILLEDPGVDSLFIYLLIPIHRVRQALQSMTEDEEKARAMADDFIKTQSSDVARLEPTYGKPVVGGTFCNPDEPFIAALQSLGVPCLPSPERAVAAIAALTRYAALRASIVQADRESAL